MKEETRDIRKAQIAVAAYELLERKGYGGASMLAIAKKARASNETLYRWYGDKQGLFRALIETNAAEVKSLLEQALARDRPPLETLADLGPRLLGLLTGDRAIALNRAAAADPTGELGAALTKAGRESIAPLIAQVIARASEAGLIHAPDLRAAVSLYIDLLVGDLQIRRAIGAIPALSAAECRVRAESSLQLFLKIIAKTES